ncbi:putative membrane protein YedE/YeeE [Pedobacter sp. UYEF25]
MKGLKYILCGLFFGIVMVKSEAVSWYRIQEMFRFQSFHMYGIIFTAIFFGLVIIWLIKKFNLNDVQGEKIILKDKVRSWKRYLYGGSIFGLGWALTGACPGPMFVNVGCGYYAMLLVILGALFGTLLYGMIRNKLPH